MAAALRYALYAWIIASAIALVVQLVRRRRFDADSTSDDLASATVAKPNTDAEPAATDATTEQAKGDEPENAQRPAAVARPIADLLDGVRLPAELSPIVPDGVVQDDSYLCLLTNTASPEDVGLKMSVELERLGYEVVGISEEEAVAQRGDDVVSLHIDPTPHETVDAGLRRYPQATSGDVVVEVWTGAGPKP